MEKRLDRTQTQQKKHATPENPQMLNIGIIDKIFLRENYSNIITAKEYIYFTNYYLRKPFVSGK